MPNKYKVLPIDILRGRNLKTKIEELFRNSSLPPQGLSAYVEQRLGEILRYAINSIPYYMTKYGKEDPEPSFGWI